MNARSAASRSSADRFQPKPRPTPPGGTLPSAGDGDRFLTISEVTVLLGVSKMTAYRMIDRGELGGVRVSPRSIRVRESVVRAYLGAREPTPPDPARGAVSGVLGMSARAACPAVMPAPGSPPTPAPRLTRREREVVTALCQPALSGEAFAAPADVAQIAAALHITRAAVKQRLARLYRRYGIPAGPGRRLQLANLALTLGLAAPPTAPAAGRGEQEL